MNGPGPHLHRSLAFAAAVGLLAFAPSGGVRLAASFSGQPPQWRRSEVRDLGPGKLLVSARNLPDPNFADTIVLLVEYDADHAVGLIVNRPTHVSIDRALPRLDAHRMGAEPVFFGGPVAVTSALALVRSRRPPRDARHIFGDVHLVGTRPGLDEAFRSEDPSTGLRVYVGCAGWGEGQLQKETASGGWHVLPGDAEIVFDRAPDSVWQRQIDRAEAPRLLARAM